jgi:phosphopantothenoylcysteine decarboxylase/phosphopantothenate--cysteine ligase
MKQLSNKRILVGVTGSIAAYKAAQLVRDFRAAGAEVRVVMTRAAVEFVTPMTFQALSAHPVATDLLDEKAEAAMGHIALARWADAVVVAPASANFIARLAQGRADDLLSTVCLASAAPLCVAPAMNQQMWSNPATVQNVETLRARAVHLFGPETGDQACGDVGPGRMLEPQHIVAQTADLFESGLLSGVKVMVSAGPTREPIDPVRYISNRSSGRMGYAIAAAVVEAGGHCVLVSGPTCLTPPERVEFLQVQTAREMHQAVFEHIEDCEIYIGTAAVSDYRPSTVESQKIKKQTTGMTLQLERNPDIIADVADVFPHIFTVGFAAETQNLHNYALKKLQDKQLNMVAANQVSDQKIGFDSELNALSIFWHGGRRDLPTATKQHIARQLIESIAELYNKTEH